MPICDFSGWKTIRWFSHDKLNINLHYKNTLTIKLCHDVSNQMKGNNQIVHDCHGNHQDLYQLKMDLQSFSRKKKSHTKSQKQLHRYKSEDVETYVTMKSVCKSFCICSCIFLCCSKATTILQFYLVHEVQCILFFQVTLVNF